jgi:Ni/Fe-hydrogenase subunit HybB-like protein
MNKINVSITGMLRESGTTYFPALSEFIVTISIIAGGLLAFKLAVKYFNVFSAEKGGDI